MTIKRFSLYFYYIQHRSLKEENKRLMLKINNPMQKSDSNIEDNTTPSSKSSTDVETSDKTIDRASPDSLSEKIPNTEPTEDSLTVIEIQDSRPNIHINTSKEFNNNLCEYVVVTDNLDKPGLVVVDSSEDNDEADKISMMNNNLKMPR